MMILSIGKVLQYQGLNITSTQESNLSTCQNIETYDYIIISGGDGTIRRVVKALQNIQHSATFILNPTGSFNVIAKLHKVPKIKQVLKALASGQTPPNQKCQYYTLNEEVFLFSAGNMGDLQHILLSETLRFGLLKHGILKYILALVFLLPLHIILTPFMLLSKSRFFIFTPMPYIKKFGSFYAKVETMTINLQSHYNHIELDGDIVTIEESILHIRPAGHISIVT